MAYVGQRIVRKEDERFITGKGRYTDDIVLPNQTHAVFVRTPLAHATIKRIDTATAKAMQGVVGVFTGADIEGLGGLPCGWLITNKDGSPMVEPPHPSIATDRVRYVGDIVAMVVAETKQAAKDAASTIFVDYEELPVVPHLAAAVDGTNKVWDEAPDNVCFDWHLGDKEATDAAFASAAHVVEIDLVNQRVIPNAMEPRAANSHYDPSTDMTTVYTTSQNPHLIRLLLGAFVMSIPEHKLRIVAPDVGGGFGSKIFLYAEEVLTTWATRKLHRPVKWTAERSESFQTDAHGRDHISKARLALSEDGKFLGLHETTAANMGAYLSTFGPAVPTWLHGTLMAGVYTTPAIYVEVKGYFSNTCAGGCVPGRGPSRSHLHARATRGRRRARSSTWTGSRSGGRTSFGSSRTQTPVAVEYDVGDYDSCLDQALAASDWAGFEARRAGSPEPRQASWHRHLHLRGGVRDRAIRARRGLGGAGWAVRVGHHPRASHRFGDGVHRHPQPWSGPRDHVCANRGRRLRHRYRQRHGRPRRQRPTLRSGWAPTARVRSRWAAPPSPRPRIRLWRRARRLRPTCSRPAPKTSSSRAGSSRCRAPISKSTSASVALTAYVPHNYPIEELEPGLEESAFYDPKNFTFPSGAHIIELEIDPDTGMVELQQVVVVDDIGTVINPLIVDGQIHGGLAQGIGQALYEGCQYDDSGQLVTGSYMNYTMPRAADFPQFTTGLHITPCTHNPHRRQGRRRGGLHRRAPGRDQRRHRRVDPAGHHRHVTMPATPHRIWQAIRAAQQS